MVIMTLTVDGIPGVRANFDAKARRVEDVAPVADLILNVFRGAARATFDMMGDRGGGPAWEPDTMEWMVKKIRMGLDPRTEFATHALYKSLTTGGVVRVTRSSVSLGSGVRYAKYQTRQLIKLTVEERNEVRQIWFDYIVHG
jgi:hypothetical protein